MLIIPYSKKVIQELNEQGIVAKIISYYVSEEDLDMFADDFNINAMDNPDMPRQVVLEKDNIYDYLVDDMENNHIIMAGETKDGECIINQYIVEKGMNILLAMIETFSLE